MPAVARVPISRSQRASRGDAKNLSRREIPPKAFSHSSCPAARVQGHCHINAVPGTVRGRPRRERLGWGTIAASVLALASLASLVPRTSLPSVSSASSGSRSFVATLAASPMTVVVENIEDESQVLRASWREVLDHMNTRLSYEDPALRFDVVDLSRGGDLEQLAASKVVYALNVQTDNQVEAVLQAVSPLSSFVALNSSKLLESRNTLHISAAPTSGFLSNVGRVLGEAFGGGQAASQNVLSTIKELYHRQSADDLLFSFLVYFNAVTKPVQSIVNSTKRSDAGLNELVCMVKNCGREILNCVTDDTCSKGLACLNTCAFNDQVCSYLCISSYESAAFEQFSLCILQRHNCLGLTAEIPANPRAQPMETFRGTTMTHELAETLFNGWLERSQENFSWRVFAGMNAAFDRFPCQYQLFFKGAARNSYWYRPVFKVQTLEGETVWRERLYRMRRQPKSYRDDGLPVFRLSVLDNGVTSLEDWTVLSCDERQSEGTPEWCVFSYAGAASKAGMGYYGAILASRDGRWPTDQRSLDMIEDSLERSGIKMWELFSVDNSQCDDFNPSVTALPAVGV